MYAMHYEIPLPRDYDMQIIRTRVATRGTFTDDFPGLRFKAYLMREAGIAGSDINAYAPFYLWDDTDQMGAFLWGGRGFGGIVTDFGRPSVQTWTGVDVHAGSGAAPSFATKQLIPLADGADPAALLPALKDAAATRAMDAGVYSVTLAIDPRTWQAVLFTLWDAAPPAATEGIRYELLHLSQPK